MKAKLVKYPYDEKKYRWDTWYQGKEFEYFWDESLPNNFDTIEPYFETKPKRYGDFAYININSNSNDNGYSNIDISSSFTTKSGLSRFYIEENCDVSNYFSNIRKNKFVCSDWTASHNNTRVYMCPYITATLRRQEGSYNCEVYSLAYFTYSYSGTNLTIDIVKNRQFKNYMWINKTSTIDNNSSLQAIGAQIANDFNLSYTNLTVNGSLDAFDTVLTIDYTAGNRPIWPSRPGSFHDADVGNADGITILYNPSTKQVESIQQGVFRFPASSLAGGK